MAGAEGNIVGEVGLKVVPVDPAAQFQAGVDQIIKRLEKQAQFQVKAAGLEQVQQQANTAGQAFAEAAFQAAGLTAAIYGIKAGIEGAISKLSGLFDQLAQARAGFTSILHSEAAGGQLLNDIREFARVSPFVTQELVNYSQQLLGVGVAAGKILPLLRSTGDIISSVGGDTANLGRVLFTLTQIKSIGSLKGQDTLQLQNSLIPITKYLSEYLHKSAAEIVKMRENSLITSEDVFNALNQQGEKVKGAMDRATRNIQGAKAILSDTITQLFQNQPVLNKIFEDIYKGIQSFANKLGEDSFQQAFAQFFDGVNKLYEGLKPLLETIGKLAGSGAISALQIFGTAIGVLGDALKAIPQFAIEAIARVFLALGALKAPLLLISYVTSIKTMASAIIPATTNLAKLGTQATVTAAEIDVETAALRANTAATEGNAVANKTAAVAGAAASPGTGLRGKGGKFGTGVAIASIGAVIGGSALSQSNNPTAKTAGGALQGAGIGAQIGMIAGPEGAVVGAAIGAAIGGITSFLGQADAKIKKHIEEMKKLGEEDAKAFIEASARSFATGSAERYTSYVDQIAAEKALLTDLEEPRRKTQDILEQGFGKGRVSLPKSAEEQGVQANIDALTGAKAAEFDPINYGLEQLVANLDKSEAGFVGLTHEVRGHVRVVSTDIPKAAQFLKGYGIELADLGNPEKLEGIVTLIKSFDGLTTAQQKATTEAIKFNTQLDEAKKASAAIFDPIEQQLQSRIDAAKAVTEAEAAQYDFSSKTAPLSAELAALKAEEAMRAERLAYYLGIGYALTTATYRANIEGEQEYQRLLGMRRTAQNNKTAQDRLTAVNENDPANTPFARDIMGEIKTRQDAADKAAKDAQSAADTAAKDAITFAKTMKDATESLADKLTAAAEDIAAAAERWVGSIKERTQYETAVSAGTATKNAQKQIKDLTEITAGLAELRARGLSQDAIKSLGIDNVSDVKQVRKLLRASPGDLSGLSASVSTLNQKATDLATREEDTRTRKNITVGVMDAAKALGLDITKDQAAGIGANFTITTISNADEIAAAIIAALSSGSIGR